MQHNHNRTWTQQRHRAAGVAVGRGRSLGKRCSPKNIEDRTTSNEQTQNPNSTIYPHPSPAGGLSWPSGSQQRRSTRPVGERDTIEASRTTALPHQPLHSATPTHGPKQQAALSGKASEHRGKGQKPPKGRPGTGIRRVAFKYKMVLKMDTHIVETKAKCALCAHKKMCCL